MRAGVAWCASTLAGAAATDTGEMSVADPARVFFKDPSYDGQFARTLAAAIVGAADLGEVFATARRVGTLSGASWHDVWAATAATAKKAADDALAANSRISARSAFLRASEYFRQAYYFIRSNVDDARLQAAYHAHADTFVAATGLMDSHAEHVRIPYQSTTISGYLFAPDATGAARPTLLFPCGYDSTAEAGWVNVPAALERGYNVLNFEGPGQGEALFTQHLYFRRDYEAVLTPVVDWLQTRKEVDAARVGLVGRSFGGYLAPRGAAFEHRLAALVCDPAQPDMGARLPTGFVGRVAGPVVEAQMHFSASRAEFFGARMASHGITAIDDYFAELRRFNMIPDAKGITCPTLIVESENDFAGGSGQELKDAMTAPADLIHLTAGQGADGHCAGLGQEIWNEAVYGWLDRMLQPNRA
jgi:Alpha/beta hydrolase family